MYTCIPTSVYRLIHVAVVSYLLVPIVSVLVLVSVLDLVLVLVLVAVAVAVVLSVRISISITRMYDDVTVRAPQCYVNANGLSAVVAKVGELKKLEQYGALVIALLSPTAARGRREQGLVCTGIAWSWFSQHRPAAMLYSR